MNDHDEYTIISTGDDEDEPLELPDPGNPTAPKRRLNAAEKLQIAVWIVEGMTAPKIQTLMAKHDIPVVSQVAIGRYRHNQELIEGAKRYLRQEISTVHLAEKAVRIRQLQRHADRLWRLMEELGLMETTTKITGYERGGAGPLTSTEEKFANTLSKEWRDTLEQIRKEVEPIERVLLPTTINNTQNNIFTLSKEDQEQFAAAMRWTPMVMPRVVELIDSETVQRDDE